MPCLCGGNHAQPVSFVGGAGEGEGDSGSGSATTSAPSAPNPYTQEGQAQLFGQTLCWKCLLTWFAIAVVLVVIYCAIERK